MLLFTISGALLMLRYANDGDPLPILGGFVCMAIGATILLRTPGRFRGWARRSEYRAAGADVEDENEAYAYDEALVRVHDR
ncbi:MAG TPA: hypothetical protein VGR28_15400, partial [Candidatus Thermoplasmatota archaeon]|nr:hypothetical protein [Candidatus Thermoplasmatota archaeon]